MTFSEMFPRLINDWLADRYGSLQEIQPLKGLSQNEVWRVSCTAGTVLVKRSQQAAEAEFYEQVAPQLQAQGVQLPARYWSRQVQNMWWLIIEYVPHVLSPDRWSADPAVVGNLAHLHGAQLTHRPRHLYRPQWTSAMTTAVLSFYTADEQAVLQPLLERLAASCQPLTADLCYISGDPNPRNWGVRPNGEVVLYDWERFGRGTPAIDLAISVPGLGTVEIFTRLADRYRQVVSQRGRPELAPTAVSIGVAKCWNVVEFLSMAHNGLVADTTFLPQLTTMFYQWLQQTRVWLLE